MQSLSKTLQAANNMLAAYAIPHGGILGRVHEEPTDETRFPFQRDRDRIIHSQAFRRLQGKTQVFVAGEGDHYRTRLTHTMEVAQISRDIARTMRLNEDLAEAIALAHDLGHPPFGHAGEDALDQWMRSQGSSFEHNAQSLRIVMVLEEHSALYKGLNVNREILEGMQKHRSPHDSPKPDLLMHDHPHDHDRALSLEAQVVNIADEIAYTAHDCEDGMRAGLFTSEGISQTALGRRALEKSKPRGTSLRGALIHLLVTDLYATSQEILDQKKIGTLDDVYTSTSPLLSFSPQMIRDLEEIRSFLWEHMYLHPTVLKASNEGKNILKELCEVLYASPTEKIIELQAKTGSRLAEAVKDYVSGMTDAYAMQARTAK